MLKINILAVGKIKERHMAMGVEEYVKRLSKYCDVTIIEVADEKTPDRASKADNIKTLMSEGERLLKYIRDDNYVVTLEIDGDMLSSEGFADKIQTIAASGRAGGGITFVIGGSLGLCEPVKKKADYRLSFSKMTFPHMLMRMILLEQIYRSFRIMNNEPYHK